MSSSLSIPSSTVSAALATASCPANTVAQIPIKTGPYCGVAVQIGSNNDILNATSAMQICCRDAPIISLSHSCDIYCNAWNQTIDQLTQCLLLNFGANKGDSSGILCSSHSAAAARPHSASKIVVLVTVLLGISSLANSLV